MYKCIKIFWIFIYLITNQAIGEEMRSYKDVSIIQLLANPEKYDGALITVIGFTLVTDRTSKIYVSHIDYERNIPFNSLSLALNRKESKEYLKITKNFKVQKQYSIIEGTFNAKRKKSNLVNIGTIENITRFDAWDYSFDSGIDKK